MRSVHKAIPSYPGHRRAETCLHTSTKTIYSDLSHSVYIQRAAIYRLHSSNRSDGTNTIAPLYYFATPGTRYDNGAKCYSILSLAVEAHSRKPKPYHKLWGSMLFLSRGSRYQLARRMSAEHADWWPLLKVVWLAVPSTEYGAVGAWSVLP